MRHGQRPGPDVSVILEPSDPALLSASQRCPSQASHNEEQTLSRHLGM